MFQNSWLWWIDLVSIVLSQCFLFYLFFYNQAYGGIINLNDHVIYSINYSLEKFNQRPLASGMITAWMGAIWHQCHHGINFSNPWCKAHRITCHLLFSGLTFNLNSLSIGKKVKNIYFSLSENLKYCKIIVNFSHSWKLCILI